MNNRQGSVIRMLVHKASHYKWLRIRSNIWWHFIIVIVIREIYSVRISLENLVSAKGFERQYSRVARCVDAYKASWWWSFGLRPTISKLLIGCLRGLMQCVGAEWFIVQYALGLKQNCNLQPRKLPRRSVGEHSHRAYLWDEHFSIVIFNNGLSSFPLFSYFRR